MCRWMCVCTVCVGMYVHVTYVHVCVCLPLGAWLQVCLHRAGPDGSAPSRVGNAAASHTLDTCWPQLTPAPKAGNQ